VLDELRAGDAPLHMDELARRLALRGDRVAQVLDALQRDGLVELRGYVVALTDDGRALGP
jgi:Mn-dependent DtxR family transcriptional regulator